MSTQMLELYSRWGITKGVMARTLSATRTGLAKYSVFGGADE